MAQWGMYTDEQTKGTATGLGMSRSKYYDPLSCHFLSREDRFGNPYIGGDDGSAIIFGFQVISAIPLLGAPCALAMAVEDIREGDYVSGGLNIAGAVLPLATDAVLVGKGLRVVGEAEAAMAAAARASSEIDTSLNFAANEARYVVGQGGRNAVVIGENMDRVEMMARISGAEYYPGLPGYKRGITTFREAWLHNRGWLVDKIRNGYEIIDIGIDESRGTRSLAYGREARLVGRLKPPGLRSVPFPPGPFNK